MNYIAYSGGGESMSAILGGQVSVGVNGLAELAPHIAAGTIRVLAISSAERLPGLDAPTFREQGVDVEIENWRSVVAPPGVSVAERQRLERTIEAMVRSEPWKAALERYRWNDRYLAGDRVRPLHGGRGSAGRRHPRPAGHRAADDRHGDGRRRALSALRPGRARRHGVALRSVASCADGGTRRRQPRRVWPAAERAFDPGRGGGASSTCCCSIGGIRARVDGDVLADGAGVRQHPSRCATRASAWRLSVAAYLLFARLLQLSLPGLLAGSLATIHVDMPQPRPVACAGFHLIAHGTTTVSSGSPAPMLETIRLLADGFASALTWPHLAWAFGGVTLGTAVGVLPGIGPALTVALLLPITFSLDPVSAFIMFGGIYYGAMYGGSTTSILINSPGETASIVTAIDGHMMARQGRASAALATAADRVVRGRHAGHHRVDVLRAGRWRPSRWRFGPAEYFAPDDAWRSRRWRCCSATSLARGLLSLFLGLALGLVGIDQLTGNARFSFGIPQLLDGIDVMILVIGLFAVGETLFQAWRHGRDEGARGDAARVHRDEPRGLAPIVEAVAARHRDRVSARRAAVRGIGDSDVRVLHGEKRLSARPKSSARARSKASPGPRRPTTPPRPACWCRC